MADSQHSPNNVRGWYASADGSEEMQRDASNENNLERIMMSFTPDVLYTGFEPNSMSCTMERLRALSAFTKAFGSREARHQSRKGLVL